jgi:hypothetical protein
MPREAKNKLNTHTDIYPSTILIDPLLSMGGLETAMDPKLALAAEFAKMFTSVLDF